MRLCRNVIARSECSERRGNLIGLLLFARNDVHFLFQFTYIVHYGFTIKNYKTL